MNLAASARATQLYSQSYLRAIKVPLADAPVLKAAQSGCKPRAAPNVCKRRFFLMQGNSYTRGGAVARRARCDAHAFRMERQQIGVDTACWQSVCIASVGSALRLRLGLRRSIPSCTFPRHRPDGAMERRIEAAVRRRRFGRRAR